MSDLETNLFRLYRITSAMIESRDPYSGNLILDPRRVNEIADALEQSASIVVEALRRAFDDDARG